MTRRGSAPLVTFTRDGVRYAFEVPDVIEVTALVPVTPVPRTGPRLLGVTSWRGRTIPVVDPRGHLKREAAKPDVKSRILVVGRPSPFGVAIDEPGRLLRSPDRHPVESVGREGPAAPGVRLVRTAEGLVRVLDPEAVLGDVRTLAGDHS